MMKSTRRSAIAALGTAAFSGALRAAAGPKPIRLGGPIFLKSQDPVALAREHRRLGYGAGQCPNFLKTSDSARIHEVEKAFAAENVIIAEVGAWKNMLDPDPQKRRENLEYVVDRMALADAVGARCCVDIAGSYDEKVWYGPNPKNLSSEFFDATVQNCRHVIDAVKPKRAKFSIEMMGWSVPDGPDSYVKLVKAVDRPAFGVHLDVCNGINCPTRFYRNTEFIRECFQKMGRWIVSCHAKDLHWEVELNVHFVEVAPGKGQVDYTTYLRELSKLPADVPLMMEHLKTAAEYDEARQYIFKTGKEAGLSFV